MRILFDTNAMTQDQVNLTQAGVSALLFQAGITHDGVYCEDGVCNIVNPSAAVSISQGDLIAFLNAQDQARAVGLAAYIAAHPEEYE